MIRGNKFLSGTHGKVTYNGLLLMELSKIEAKVTPVREDVQVGMDVDSKIVGLKGEGTMAIKKVYTRFADVLEEMKTGKDPRGTIIASLKDPDAVGGQTERWSIDNVALNELPLIGWEQGKRIDQEFAFGFTASDLVNLDAIEEA